MARPTHEPNASKLLRRGGWWRRLAKRDPKLIAGMLTLGDYGLGLASLFEKIMRKALQILAVEDEKAVAQILAVVLGGPMAQVIRAADGWEALIKLGAAARPFDVVITDHRMPRMGGLELVRRLRTRNFEGKILVLSAHLSDEDIRAYEELGVDMMMSKPFDFEEIQNAVAILTKGASVAVAA
jgi:CheY-like chemotaxis protein